MNTLIIVAPNGYKIDVMLTDKQLILIEKLQMLGEKKQFELKSYKNNKKKGIKNNYNLIIFFLSKNVFHTDETTLKNLINYL